MDQLIDLSDDLESNQSIKGKEILKCSKYSYMLSAKLWVALGQ